MPSGNVRNRDDQRSPQGRHKKKRRVFLSSSDSSDGDVATSHSKHARNKESDPSFEKPLLRPNHNSSPKSNQTSSPYSIQKPSSRPIQKSLPQSIEKPSPRPNQKSSLQPNQKSSLQPNQKSSLQPNPKSSSELRHKFLPGRSSFQSAQKPSPLSQGFLPGKSSPQSKPKPSSLGQRGPPRSNQKTPTPRKDQKPSTQLSQKPPPPSDQKSSPRPTQKKASPEPEEEALPLFAPRVTPWALSAPSHKLRPLPSQKLRPLPSQRSIPPPNWKSDNAHNGEDKDELNSTPQTPVPPSKRDANILITENEAEGSQKAGSDIDILDANVEESSSSDDELFVTQEANYDIDNLDANKERNIQGDKDSGYSESNSSDFVADDGLVVSLRRSKRIKAARAGPDKNNRSTAKRDTTARSRERSEKEWGAAVKQLDEKLDTLDKRISHLHAMIAKDQKAPDDEGETYRGNIELKTRKLDLEKRRIDLEEQRLGLEKENSTRLHQVIRDLSSCVNDLQSRRSKTPPDNKQHKENGASEKHGRVDSALGDCDDVR